MNDGILKDEDILLRTEDLTKYFGGLGAVVDLNMAIKTGEILALIGPNGAGKTTLFNLITGFLRSTRGEVIFKEEKITNFKPHRIARKGIVRSFQANVMFMEKTVKENVLMGFHIRYRNGYLKELFNAKSYTSERIEIEEQAEEILDFFSMIDLQDQPAGNLTHGHQRMLGVAVALAPRPALLLLDEPVAGLNDEETTIMMDLIKKIRDQSVTILLVEHDMKAVMGNCERIVVMDYGKMIAQGTPSEVANNERVIEAYLGAGEFTA
jgi:branched-chain amino acid transport system ATP-binding protein